MGLLQQIQSGRTRMPPRILVYGTEGIGKVDPGRRHTPSPSSSRPKTAWGRSTATSFRWRSSFDDVVAALAELQPEEHDYETVVIDSLDWLERLIWDALCRARIRHVDREGRRRLRQGLHPRADLWRKILEHLDRAAHTSGAWWCS